MQTHQTLFQGTKKRRERKKRERGLSKREGGEKRKLLCHLPKKTNQYIFRAGKKEGGGNGKRKLILLLLCRSVNDGQDRGFICDRWEGRSGEHNEEALSIFIVARARRTTLSCVCVCMVVALRIAEVNKDILFST